MKWLFPSKGDEPPHRHTQRMISLITISYSKYTKIVGEIEFLRSKSVDDPQQQQPR